MTFFSRRKIAPFWSKVKVQSLNIKPSAKKTPSTLTCGVTPAALPYGSDHITALKRLPPCRCPPKLVFRGELTLEQSSGAVRLTSEKPTSLKRHVIVNFFAFLDDKKRKRQLMESPFRAKNLVYAGQKNSADAV